MTKTELLFVYGTLKAGYGNNSRFLAGAEFVGEAVTATPTYKMFDFGPPVVMEVNSGGAKVRGEVYRISEKIRDRCDQLEGHPDLYRREQRRVLIHWPDTPEEVTAWIYLWQGNKGSAREAVKPNAEGNLVWPRKPIDWNMIKAVQ